MNKNNAKDYLPLIQALAEGKTIQFHGSHSDEWTDVANPGFNYEPSRYRIKVEPRVVYVNEYAYGLSGNVHYSRSSALGNAVLGLKSVRKFIEVME